MELEDEKNTNAVEGGKEPKPFNNSSIRSRKRRAAIRGLYVWPCPELACKYAKPKGLADRSGLKNHLSAVVIFFFQSLTRQCHAKTYNLFYFSHLFMEFLLLLAVFL